MLARLKRFSFISIPNDRQFVKRVSEKILMDLAILRGICSLRAEKTFFHGILGGKSSLEARLRTRKVGALSCSFRVQLFGASPKPLFAPPKLSVKNQKIPRIVRDSGGDNAYRSPLRPRLRLTRWTGCPAFFFALDAFVRATGLLAGALSTRMGVPPRRILPSLPMTTG
jgi:hypothetical protein